MNNLILIHPSEEAVKGTYRPLFERNLIIKLTKELKGLNKSIKRKYQRIFIEANPKDIDKIKDILLNIKEIGYFSIPTRVPTNIKEIQKTSLNILNNSNKTSFRPKIKISYKAFPIKAPQFTKDLGNFLVKNSKKTLDFVDSELTIYIEILENATYIYTKRYNL